MRDTFRNQSRSPRRKEPVEKPASEGDKAVPTRRKMGEGHGTSLGLISRALDEFEEGHVVHRVVLDLEAFLTADTTLHLKEFLISRIRLLGPASAQPGQPTQSQTAPEMASQRPVTPRQAQLEKTTAKAPTSKGASQGLTRPCDATVRGTLPTTTRSYAI
jgi:hypothetical protein